MLKNNYILGILLLSSFVLTGCSPLDKMRAVDAKVGEYVEKFEQYQDMDIASSSPKEPELKIPNTTKKKIDIWLKENGFNRYGDPVMTSYEKGTPLMNSQTGELIDRLEYIKKNIPDILEKIK